MSAGRAAAALVRGYQRWLRPMRASAGPTCRFEPTCSAYAVDAFSEWGLLKGLWLSIRRVGRCNPWGGVGVDPVPLRRVSAPPAPATTEPNRQPPTRRRHVHS